MRFNRDYLVGCNRRFRIGNPHPADIESYPSREGGACRGKCCRADPEV